MPFPAKLSLALAASFVVGVGAGVYYARTRTTPPPAQESITMSAAAIDEAPHVELASGRADTIVVPKEIVDRLGIQVSTAAPVSQAQPLRMPGSLMLDA